MTVEYLDAKRIQGSSTSTQIQGYAGGLGTYSADYAGGGGGGATTTGFAQDANSIGGTGIANPITGSEVGQLDSGTYYFSGGGGGGKSSSSNTCLGGLGGGGTGGSTSATDGTVNTGGGGGAHSSTGNAGAGGSGVVLVTYKTSEITDDSSDGSLESGSSIPSGYAIRKFTSSGANTFSISAGSGNVQYVVVAGGGGGGSGGSNGNDYGGGGGGAGGFLTGTKSMSAGDYTVTVGAGGVATTPHGNDGNNSVFDDITSTAGGGGAGSPDANKNGNNGGSGGGASRAGTVGTGASTITDDKATLLTTGQGYADFNGSSQSLTSPAASDFKFMSDGSAFSMAFWVYRDSDITSTEPSYVGNNGTSTSDVGFALFNTSSGGGLRYFISNGTALTTAIDTTIADTTWTNIIITYGGSAGTITVYKDGVSVGTFNASSYSFSASNPAYALAIGKNIGRTTYVDARIADIGFWNIALSAGDIAKLKDGTRITSDGTGFDYAEANLRNHLALFSNLTDDGADTKSWTNGGTVSTTTTNSSTNPPIDSFSNLPENTIFNETDTQTQYWLQTLDGVVGWFPTWYDTFVSDRGWTTSGSSVIDTTDKQWEQLDITPMYIGIPELDTKWVCDLDVYWDSLGSGGWQGYILFTSYGATAYPSSTGTPQYIGLRQGIDGKETLRITTFAGGEANTTDVYMATGASVDTWYYYRIVRDGNDATLTRYTSDANRTSDTSGVSITISGFVSTVSWVESTKLKFLDGTGYSSNQPFYVKNVRIYNGVTSI